MIISDTTTTAVRYLSPTAFFIVHRGEFSVFYMELCITFPFLVMSVITAYLCSNYLLYSKLCRRAAVGCCPQILHHRDYNLCCPSCTTKEPEYYIRDSIRFKPKPFGINFDIVCCRPIPSNVNLLKERPVCISFTFEGHR